MVYFLKYCVNLLKTLILLVYVFFVTDISFMFVNDKTHINIQIEDKRITKYK